MKCQPSDLHLTVPPFVGVFGRAELEHAAAIIVGALQRGGHGWEHAVTVDEACAAMEVEPLRTLCTNPFFKPEPWALVAGGLAFRLEDGSMLLTVKAVAMLIANHYEQRVGVLRNALLDVEQIAGDVELVPHEPSRAIVARIARAREEIGR